jgi:hypothetical protein
MTITQFAALLIRIYCVYAFIVDLSMLTEVAYGIYLVINSTSIRFPSQGEFLLAMYVLRFLIFFITGIVCLIFTKPLARMLVKGLESVKHEDAA